jgi:ATP-dependent Clp protease adaptor protein ClpS
MLRAMNSTARIQTNVISGSATIPETPFRAARGMAGPPGDGGDWPVSLASESASESPSEPPPDRPPNAPPVLLPDPPPGRPPTDPSKERDRSVATKERAKSARPPRFKVILYNDDYTPMEFVVQVLEHVFKKSPSAATQIMLQIHRGGMGVAGVFVLEIAETKSTRVLRMAEERGYPLRTGVEKE